MDNTTNATSNFTLHPDPLAALCYSLVIIPGALLYAPVLYALVVQRTTFNQPFYTTVFSLAVGDLGRAVIYGQVYLVPSLLHGAPLGGASVGSAVAFFEAVMFMGVAGTTFLMSLSRLGAVAFPIIKKPTWNTKLFGHRPLVYWVAGVWAHGLGIVGILVASGCRNAIADSLLSPTYYCDTALSRTVNEWIALYVTCMISVVLLLVNIATLIVLACRPTKSPTASREENRSYALEMRFLSQSLLVYLSLLLNNLFFQLVATFKLWSYTVSVLLGVFMFLNSTLSPIVFIAFNRSLRNVVALVMFGPKISPWTTADTSTGGGIRRSNWQASYSRRSETPLPATPRPRSPPFGAASRRSILIAPAPRAITPSPAPGVTPRFRTEE